MRWEDPICDISDVPFFVELTELGSERKNNADNIVSFPSAKQPSYFFGKPELSNDNGYFSFKNV